MTESAQDAAARADLEAAKAFKQKLMPRPIAVAVAANVVLAALCLGVPYYRGKVQAEQSLRAFAGFAGCLLGAEPGTTLGLGMPPGEADHFAAQVMLAGKDWPARCKPKLRAVAPEEAVFLFPSIKTTGGDVRTLVALTERELDALQRQRLAQDGAGRVPGRPLLALSRMRAGLTLLARAAGVDEHVDSDAVRFRAPGLVPPARMPIMAGSMAALQVWAGPDGLRAIAMDGRGVSWLQVEDGKLDRHRVRRTSLVRAALRADERPLLVWAMPQEKCEERADRCVPRATGVALLGDQDYQLPTPTWLGGHPAGRADRSLRWGLAGRVDLLARKASNGELELRRYTLPPATSAIAAPTVAAEPAAAADASAAQNEQATPPLAPGERYAWPVAEIPSDALLLPSLPAAIAFASGDADRQRAYLWSYETAAPPVALGSARGAGAWLLACEAEHTRWIAFGTRDALSLARVDADGSAVTPLDDSALPVGEPLAPEDPGHDRVQLLCTPDQARLFIASADGRLLALGCDRAQCSAPSELARDIHSYDVVQRGEHSLIAYARATHPEITVRRLDANGRPLSRPIVPAACWDPTSGMCGQPTLVADSGRLLLVARDGADLLAIESNDGGERWLPMSGLKVDSAISTDPSAPMNQHRLRKGLE